MNIDFFLGDRRISMESEDIHELQEKIQFYEAILDNIHNGVMITDPKEKTILLIKPCPSMSPFSGEPLQIPKEISRWRKKP
jgi:hypothetical protein